MILDRAALVAMVSSALKAEGVNADSMSNDELLDWIETAPVHQVPFGWMNKHAVYRFLSLAPILHQNAFDYRIARKRTDAHTIPLYLAKAVD